MIENLVFKHGIAVAILLIIVAIAIMFFFNGLVVFLVWKYLVLWLIPTLPVLSYIQSCVAAVILSVIGSFFKGGNK